MDDILRLGDVVYLGCVARLRKGAGKPIIELSKGVAVAVGHPPYERRVRRARSCEKEVSGTSLILAVRPGFSGRPSNPVHRDENIDDGRAKDMLQSYPYAR